MAYCFGTQTLQRQVCPYASSERAVAQHNRLGQRFTQSRAWRRCRQQVMVQSAVQVTGPKASGVEAGLELDSFGVQRMPFRSEGWQFWNWRSSSGPHRIHYVQSGDSGPPILLIHGFGASAYHWRYNIPELSKQHRVFAVDLLGFGWSDKALVDYQYGIWSEQLAAFIKDVIGEPAVLVGNSLGAYNSLATAALHPELVRGVTLINGAGRFDDVRTAVTAPLREGLTSSEAGAVDAVSGNAARDLQPSARSSPNNAGSSSSGGAAEQRSLLDTLLSPVATVGKRLAVYASFLLTKQPGRVRSVLNQVYIDHRNVDDDLVKSIVQPAQDPKAAEVFYRVITGSGSSINTLIDQLDGMPLLLCWGVKDPWIRPQSADRVQKLYPRAERVNINAGHCAHDEAPAEVNKALLSWIDGLPA